MDKVRDVVLDKNDILVSFDVKSLFTSVPTELAVDVCSTALESDATLPERSPIDAPDLARLLQFCLANTYFTFQECFYKQVHGTAMGASISVTAANLTMEALESRALASFSLLRRHSFATWTTVFASFIKKQFSRSLHT